MNPSASSATPISTTQSSDRPVNGRVPPVDGVVVGAAATLRGGLNCCVVGVGDEAPGVVVVGVDVLGVAVDVGGVDVVGATVDVVGGTTTVDVEY